MDRETVHEVVVPLRPDVFSRSLMYHAESEIKIFRSYQYAILPRNSSCMNLFIGVRGDDIPNQTLSPPCP